MVEVGNTLDYGHLKFCTELKVPLDMAVTAVTLAIEENPANAPVIDTNEPTMNLVLRFAITVTYF